MAKSVSVYETDPYSYSEVRSISAELGLSEPVATTLVRRGHRTPEAARAFLAADEEHDPSEFGSMGDAVGRVLAALRERRRITVHGDFDVDGVCATALLVGTLRELGAECDWLIPDRLGDGYGLSEANVQRLAERGTSLILTVDCGITASEEVRLAQRLGVEVVITDHHQPGPELPQCPILHPSLDGYPFADLCGTAVAWKLACALREEAGASIPAEQDLDLVALATVADVVPLVGENRSLVKRGLEEVRRARREGIRALIAAAGCEPTQLDEGDLAFRLAPRINAAGRLYRADAGVELFLTSEAARAEQIAAELSRANGERRATERKVDAEAEAALRALPDRLREAAGLVVAGSGWHPGVIGIVASRLVERHHRPVVVVSLDDEGRGRGSGRSIPGFDLLAGLEASGEHLTRFGGHRAAAGLELERESLDSFREAFAAHADAVLGPDDLRRTERIDAMVGGASLGLDLAEEFRCLAPFGMGNPGVRLLVPSARVRDVQLMGEGKHSRFSLHSGSHRALGVAFGRPRIGVGEDDLVDAAVRLEVNRWNGAVEPRVVLREVYPHTAEDAWVEAEAWWERFERELAGDPSQWPSTAVLEAEAAAFDRVALASANAPAAVVAELVSSGESVLAITADAESRASMAREGLRLADYSELERRPDLPAGFAHVVLVDPPPSSHLERLASKADEDHGYLHRVWGEAEWRFSLSALGEQLVRRPALIDAFRDLREAGPVAGEDLRKALRGLAGRPRSPETAARCLRVLRELGLVQGTPAGGDGEVGVVSSESTDLERSGAYRAYGARYEEARRYLEERRQP